MALDTPRELTEEDVFEVIAEEVQKIQGTLSLQVEGWGYEVDVRLDKTAIAKAVLQAIKDALYDEDDIVKLETCHLEIPGRGIWSEEESCILIGTQIRYRVLGEKEAVVNHFFRIKVEAEA